MTVSTSQMALKLVLWYRVFVLSPLLCCGRLGSARTLYVGYSAVDLSSNVLEYVSPLQSSATRYLCTGWKHREICRFVAGCR